MQRDIATLYEAGSTLREIAKEFHTTMPTVAKRLREIGVTIRPRGRPRIPLPLPNNGGRA